MYPRETAARARSWGFLAGPMARAITTLVEGKVVHDLGAGGLELSVALLELGAREVHAVDEVGWAEPRPAPWINTTPPPVVREGLHLHAMTFYGYLEKAPRELEVAFMSWPENTYLPGLVHLLQRAQVVIYLGINYDGSSCGWRGLFEHFLTRELRHHVWHHRNTLLVYGAPLPAPRAPQVLEEHAGLNQWQMFRSMDWARGEHRKEGGNDEDR